MSLKNLAADGYTSASPASLPEGVLFVSATWCPHCQATKPEMQVAAQTLGSVVPVFVVDSERNAAVIAGLRRFKGYPTIYYNDKSKLTEYSGPRKGRYIADWACGLSGKCPARGAGGRGGSLGWR